MKHAFKSQFHVTFVCFFCVSYKTDFPFAWHLNVNLYNMQWSILGPVVSYIFTWNFLLWLHMNEILFCVTLATLYIDNWSFGIHLTWKQKEQQYFVKKILTDKEYCITHQTFCCISSYQFWIHLKQDHSPAPWSNIPMLDFYRRVRGSQWQKKSRKTLRFDTYLNFSGDINSQKYAWAYSSWWIIINYWSAASPKCVNHQLGIW